MPGSFIEKLRMNGIFAPGGGRPPGSTPFGMPTMGQGLDIPSLMASAQAGVTSENALERQHEIQLAQMQQQPRLNEIAHKVAEPEKPMNVVFNPGITEYQRGTLAGRERDRESRETIAGGRIGLGREQIEGREELQNVRGNQTLDQIRARGVEGSRQINERGEIVSRQIDERGQVAEDLEGTRQSGRRVIQEMRDTQGTKMQEMRGSQGLGEIAARNKGAQQLQDTKDSTFTPGETKASQDLAVRELINTRPDLGELITLESGGRITISPNATPEQRDEINRKVFITRPTGDIPLRAAPKYTNSTVNPPAKRKSKFVKIE